MLSRVLSALHEKGWFDTSRPYEYSVHLTRGACVWLLLTRQGRGERYVKFSESVSLFQEAKRSQHATLTYPDFAPPFIGYLSLEGLELLASKAVDGLGLTPHEVRHGRRGHAVLRGLGAFFEASSHTAKLGGPTTVDNRDLREPLARYFEKGPLASLAERSTSGAAMSLASALPDLPQHGDLVLNNIGLREPQGMVIYDWEDFGASSLPGLDLFTLELSLADDPARLPEMRAADIAALRELKARACNAMGLTVADYHVLTPVYALVFRYLKRNYGPWVRERMDRLLLTLDQVRP